MTLHQFLSLPESEQNLFIAKLIHAVKHNKTAFDHAQWSVELCESIGVFDNVKFGSEVYKEQVVIEDI